MSSASATTASASFSASARRIVHSSSTIGEWNWPTDTRRSARDESRRSWPRRAVILNHTPAAGPMLKNFQL
jgi:hypothetical protein